MIADTLLRAVRSHKGDLRIRISNSIYHSMFMDIDKKSLQEEVLHVVGGDMGQECGLKLKRTKEGELHVLDDQSVWDRDNKWVLP